MVYLQGDTLFAKGHYDRLFYVFICIALYISCVVRTDTAREGRYGAWQFKQKQPNALWRLWRPGLF